MLSFSSVRQNLDNVPSFAGQGQADRADISFWGLLEHSDMAGPSLELKMQLLRQQSTSSRQQCSESAEYRLYIINCVLNAIYYKISSAPSLKRPYVFCHASLVAAKLRGAKKKDPRSQNLPCLGPLNQNVGVPSIEAWGQKSTHVLSIPVGLVCILQAPQSELIDYLEPADLNLPCPMLRLAYGLQDMENAFS